MFDSPEHRAHFTLPWRGRVGSEHIASCRGGVAQLHPHPARVSRRLADLPPPGGGGSLPQLQRERISYFRIPGAPMTKQTSIGFIGLGVMGEPICRNLARKSGAPVIAFDLRPEPLARLDADGVARAASVREIMEQASVVMLSLPSGSEVEAICAGEDGLLARSRRGQVVIDLG